MKSVVFFLIACLASCEVREEAKKNSTKQEAPKESSPPVAILPEVTQKPERSKEEEAKAKIEQATVDFLQNGLAGIWSGKVADPTALARWFIPGEATNAATAQIFVDQKKSAGKILLSAEVSQVQLSPTLDSADVGFLIQTQQNLEAPQCYTGTFHWIEQKDDSWLRDTQATLKVVPCLGAQSPSIPPPPMPFIP